MITAEQVRNAMRKRGLSQTQLARMSKVSGSVISTWLNGVREPSDISKTRIAFALDLLEPGDADDKQVSAALEPLETDDAPAARPGRDTDTDYLTDEDLAVDEIMDALGMSEPEPEPAPKAPAAPTTAPTTPTTPASAPATAEPPAPRADSAAERLYRLTRVPGVRLYEDNDRCLNIAIPRGSDLEQFAENLDTLDTMLQMDAISAEAHDAAVKSLLERAARKEAEK